MEKLEYEGDTYYYYNNKFVDTQFIEVNAKTAEKLAGIMFSQINYKALGKKPLIEYIRNTKNAGQYGLSTSACEYALVKFADDSKTIHAILPVLTSNLRNMNNSAKAVSIAEEYVEKYGYGSIALLTSLAAACCDTKEYVKARKYANMAFAKQGGDKGFNELSMVYMRIKKESAEKQD